jgi:FRG domain
MAKFERLSIREARCITDDASGKTVFHVADSHALTQAAGYLKHVCGADENIYFRGQSRLYSTLTPSLFRGKTRLKAREAAVSELRGVIESAVANSALFNSFNSVFHEPLFQHYGLRTTWLDLVDNVWVALWFACHNALTDAKSPRYLHFETRNPYKEGNTSYVYILMIGANRNQTTVPGFFKGLHTEMVDLRIGCPSIFVRPHAQHGVLFRSVGNLISRPPDYGNFVRGIIRADLRQALMWLGDGNLLNTHALMPPPFYDQGYRILLDLDLPATPRAGTIQHVGA